jgi:hypothetical protein
MYVLMWIEFAHVWETNDFYRNLNSFLAVYFITLISFHPHQKCGSWDVKMSKTFLLFFIGLFIHNIFIHFPCIDKLGVNDYPESVLAQEWKFSKGHTTHWTHFEKNIVIYCWPDNFVFRCHLSLWTIGWIDFRFFANIKN